MGPHIGMLPDQALELVFVFLSPLDLASVSQVCNRWCDLSGGRRLWSNKKFDYNQRSVTECHRAVRLLCRSRGVYPFSKLELKMESRIGRHQQIAFGDGAEELTVNTASSLMLLLCLRHLLPERVTSLKLAASYIDALTPCEALVVWETIANKDRLMDLTLTLHRGSALFLCPFQWPQQGFISNLRFNAVGNAPSGPTVCGPVNSLLQAHRHQLMSVHILNEDQQPLLELCPSYLYHLQAVMQPSLVKVLWAMRSLQSLSLHSHYAHPGVLVPILAIPRLRHKLWDLEVVVKPRHWEDDEAVPQVGTVIKLLGGFPHLGKVRLVGLDLPPRGPWNLRALLKSLPLVKSLTLDEEPCSLTLRELLLQDKGAESAVPDTLRVLTLEHAPHFMPSKHHVADEWLETLRQVLRTAPRLHVRVEHSACFAGNRRLSKVVVTPHPLDEFCQCCPGKVAEKDGFAAVYIDDMCN